MYQRLANYQDIFFLNLLQNYRLLNIILFCDILQYTYMFYLPDSSYSFMIFYNIHICFIYLIPLTVFKVDHFYFTGYFVHIPNMFILSGFLPPSVFRGALYVSYRHSKCTSNKSLFGPNHPKSNCFAGTCFILFHDFLEYKICI